MRKTAVLSGFSLMFLLVGLSSGVMAARSTRSVSRTPDPDPQALQYLRQMSDYIAGLPQFSVQGYTTMEAITSSGMTLDADRKAEVYVQRPNHIRVNSYVPDHNRQIFYDGGTATIYSPDKNLYATFPAPASIDGLVAAARNRGIALPLADLIVSRPYDSLMANVRHGYYIGTSYAAGVLCRQLAFRQKDLDWQIWIEDSATPVPRRVAIVDRAMPGSPRYTATLTDWNTSPSFGPDMFTFVPPAGAQKISITPGSIQPLPGAPRRRAR